MQGLPDRNAVALSPRPAGQSARVDSLAVRVMCAVSPAAATMSRRSLPGALSNGVWQFTTWLNIFPGVDIHVLICWRRAWCAMANDPVAATGWMVMKIAFTPRR